MRGVTLSPRMAQAAELVRRGLSDAEIAAAMGIKASSAKELVKQTRQRVALPMRKRGRRPEIAQSSTSSTR